MLSVIAVKWMNDNRNRWKRELKQLRGRDMFSHALSLLEQDEEALTPCNKYLQDQLIKGNLKPMNEMHRRTLFGVCLRNLQYMPESQKTDKQRNITKQEQKYSKKRKLDLTKEEVNYLKSAWRQENLDFKT